MYSITCAPPPVKPTMTEADARTLVSVEWDMIEVDTDLGELLGRLQPLAIAEAQTALEDVCRVRLQLRMALRRLDEPLTEAVARLEGIEAPF